MPCGCWNGSNSRSLLPLAGMWRMQREGQPQVHALHI
jgi:hypothetical protein